MVLRPRRIPIILALALLLAAAADYVVWRIATHRLLAGYLLWQGSLPQAGWEVTSDAPVSAGWPFAAMLRLDHARLGQAGLGQAGGGGFAWQAGQVTFGISALHPRRLAIEPGGEQVLSGGGRPPIRFHAGSLRATALLGAPIRAAHATAAGLIIETGLGDAVADAASIDAGWQTGIARVVLQVGLLRLPSGHQWGLGQIVSDGALEVTARGAWPAGPPAQAAAGWRDDGGNVDIGHLALRWGTLAVTGSGHLTLDAGLQPLADVTLKVADPQSAVSMLADQGAISQGAATAMQAVLSLLAMPARLAGQPPILNLPLHVAAGEATLGHIPILKLPLLTWPQ